MPLEIVGLGKAEVRFVWDEGVEDTWTARTLRQRCTCAYCQSEATGERILDPESVPADITVTSMSLVGNYGVSIAFSDQHSTGIYRFRELHASHPNRGGKAQGARS
jgi:ATP-binding protein involved in chromosome partitioning